MRNRDPKSYPGDSSRRKPMRSGVGVVARIKVHFPGEPATSECPVRVIEIIPAFDRLLASPSGQAAPISHRSDADALLSFWARLPYARAVRRFITTMLLFALGIFAASAQGTNSPSGTNQFSRVVEAAGHVEYIVGGSTNWNIATNGLALKPGDKVRTRAASRAAVQLSDRSVIRLSERTTLEILPPRRAEKKRFGLSGGSIFFFNREKPADVEFDTPLAAGAIRGTEFLLEVVAEDSSVALVPSVPSSAPLTLHLALIDGLVTLNTFSGEVRLQRGEDLRLASGQPPQITALVNANAIIQWALYYPAVLNPADLTLDANESAALKDVLDKYLSGDLLAALASWPKDFSGAKALHAQLELTVGRVNEAEKLLAEVPNDTPPKRALAELISTVRSSRRELALTNSAIANRQPAIGLSQLSSAATSSEALARTYTLQQSADLEAARAAAQRAVELAPDSGFARARLAEMELGFGNRRAALEELKHAYAASPRLAPAYALQGFDLLGQGHPRIAAIHFDKARQLDAAFAPAWLGQGLCLLHERKFTEARAAIQTAAALEPQRSLFRSYLGKTASELGDAKAAEKEFNLAKQLDENDPTAWLYSALHLWQENRLNEAIRDLETSTARNDNRAAFRSRLLLDQDRAVRSANIAALYDDAAIPDASRLAASRAVAESYANFSGHLFLADSFASRQDAGGFDLRHETARQSELLVANLLAPPGAGNLSQTLSQQEHLRFFEAKPIGVSSLSEYTSNGDWRQTGVAFGNVKGFSYALDAVYENLNGQQPNGELERRTFTLTAKQRVTSADEMYFQVGMNNTDAGDVANYYDPTLSKVGFRVHERQEPTLYAGWHHEWSPGSHTLFFAARLDDSLSLQDPNTSTIFLRQTGGVTTDVQVPPLGPAVEHDFSSDFTLYSAELQQIWESHRHSLVIGGRWQHGDVESRSSLARFFSPTIDSAIESSVDRANAYAYYTLKVCEPLTLVGGVSYDHLKFPLNADIAPLESGETSRDLLAPKAALLFTPWERGLFRASYAKSLGGLYFDNSVRLEPAQLGGFNQAFRSLIPESVAGLIPGAEFETAGVGFDQSLQRGTYFGVEAEWLTSDGKRNVGVLTNSLFLPIPDSPGSTRQELDFRERSLSAYAGQLLGENVSVGARYRISRAELNEHFPDIPDTATGLDQLEGDEKATLQQLALTMNFHHHSGVFAQWESDWFQQHNSAYPDENFWQHNLMVGYRFPRRYAELRLGLLNLFDADYRLNPLNLHATLPRGRTLAVSLRLNF